MKGARPRSRTVGALLVVATLLGVMAVFAVWANRQALETDTWVETSTELLDDEEIQHAVAGFLVETLFANVDVEGELREVLPPQVQALAGPVAGGLRQLADRAALEALQRPRVDLLWEEANRRAHEALLDLVDDDVDVDVSLDLSTVLADLGDRVGIDIAGQLPPDAGRIEILEADQLSAAQRAVALLRTAGLGLAFAALGLVALAVYLAAGWRREALRATGIAFIVIGVVALVIRSFAGDLVTESLAATAASEPAVTATWGIGTGLLAGGAWAMVGYGVVILIGAWLAGPGVLAHDGRRMLAPILHDRRVAYTALGLIVLLVFAWSPTEGTERLVPSLVLLVLAAIGLEALRAQAIREFPDESWERAQERWRRWLEAKRASRRTQP